jgi:uncharacterized protein (UPF0333 family)
MSSRARGGRFEARGGAAGRAGPAGSVDGTWLWTAGGEVAQCVSPANDLDLEKTGLRSDRGNAPLELVLIAPVILMLIGFVIAAGRVSTARNAVDAAAREAARQASVATSQAAAQRAAISGATSALAADDLNCQPTVSLLNLSQAFNTPIGRPVDIRVRVTCVVHLSDLLVPGVPGSITLNANFASPLDPYRSRNLAATVIPPQVRTVRVSVTALSHPAPHNLRPSTP